MTEKTITRKVKFLISELLRLEPEEIDPECELSADLGADSLELTELVMAIEEEFDVDISDEEVEDILTVQDVIDWLLENLDD
ncbi:MAG: acyl carrier protein [Prosthecobacter sp.]|nr:acyl carrier protein [Prosthecobacter sp.]